MLQAPVFDGDAFDAGALGEDDQYQTGGPEALEDSPSRPSRVWNRIPDDVRSAILELALEATDLSPRELAVRFCAPTGSIVRRS